MVEGSIENFINFANNKRNSAIVCFEEESDKINNKNKLIYGTSSEEISLAHKVFSILREIDTFGVEKAYIHAPSKKGIGLAVYNRLLRACAFKVIKLNTVIGITGPTGSGKSMVSKIAKDFGFKIIDCDMLARVAVKKGSKGLDALVKVFGNDILSGDNTLNRKKLAEKAFSSPENTKLLNSTILPFISELVQKEINADKVLLDAPTLFESGIDSICDVSIAVLADTEIRLNRITKRDDMDKVSALLRINAGKTDDFYKSKADFIIYNNNHIESFITEFKEIINKIVGKSK